MFSDKELEEIKRLLDESERIVLTSHSNPDGDAVGSLLGMLHYLKMKGADVKAVLPNPFPEFYAWLPGSNEIMIYEKNAKEVKQVLNDADLIFALDYNDQSRVGQMTDVLKAVQAKKFMIDHHPDPSEGFDFYFSTIETSSTGELVYDFISKLGDKALINRDIAAALYVAIMTDTGSFSFSCNNPKTYRVTADLIETGIDASKIHKLVYDNYSESRLRLLGFALSERMIIWPELHTAVIYLTKKDLGRFEYRVGDTEGLVNYPLSVSGINVSVLITEKEKKIRLSFRSKGDFPVNEVVRVHFEGGGHKNAAGGFSYVSMEKTLENVKKVMEKYKKELDYKIEY
jgi:phosphoesterase RecJ-like protein